MAKDICIEFPMAGTTYRKDAWGAYEYDEYPEWSVLAGQQRRSFLGEFSTLKEALEAFPEARVCRSGYAEPDLSGLPDGPDNP